MDSFRPPETNSSLSLAAKVDDNKPENRFAQPGAQPETGKPDFAQKIEDARKQGREQLALGLAKVKEKMRLLKEKIKALPGAIARLAENAVVEAFTLPVRIENAVDALNQKIDDAEAAMKQKIEVAKAQFEARRQDLILRTREAIENIKERSRGFFSKIKESLFSSSRKREQQDMVDMLTQFLKKAEQGGTVVTAAQLEVVKNGLLQIQDRHRQNSLKIGEFIQFYFKGARPQVGATA